jgi:hypothetical protein
MPRDKDIRIVPLPDEAVNILAELQVGAVDGHYHQQSGKLLRAPRSGLGVLLGAALA